MPETELREEVLTKFLDQGLIYIWGDNECGYRITSLGEAWITEMLATPKPKLKYVGVTGNAINTSTIVTGLIE
ncbi:MAG: hypothetical protein COA78_12050 [Blastopirellula sp.]|nr:MAG: hypothetical protein COA78_12050 [Blastopirellula sp.]